MWQTVDYKGNTVKWYEAELIEKIKAECERHADGIYYEGDLKVTDYPMAKFAQWILWYIEQAEK